MSYENYNPGIKLGAGLAPSGNGTFPLMHAKDIQADANKRRLDVVLDELRQMVENGGSGSGGQPIEVSTEAGMNAILTSATEVSIGAIYRYTGPTTSTYENGALYVIASEIPNGDEVSY